MEDYILKVIICGSCFVMGMSFANMVVKNEKIEDERTARIERIEEMAADIDLKMGLILDNVKVLKRD